MDLVVMTRFSDKPHEVHRHREPDHWILIAYPWECWVPIFETIPNGLDGYKVVKPQVMSLGGARQVMPKVMIAGDSWEAAMSQEYCDILIWDHQAHGFKCCNML